MNSSRLTPFFLPLLKRCFRFIPSLQETYISLKCRRTTNVVKPIWFNESFFVTSSGHSGTLLCFLFLFFCFLFIQEGKTTGWQPLQRALAKPAGVNSFPVPANVPASLFF